MIDHLLGFPIIRTTHLAYFYFDYKSQDTQTPYFVVSCLLRQLLTQHQTVPNSLNQLYSRFGRKQGRPSWQELIETFTDLCCESGAYVVLDALDECEVECRRKIINFIGTMRRKNVRLFATSRPYPEDVRNAFRGASIVDVEASGADLKEFLKLKIREATTLSSIMTRDLQERIISTIVPKTQGMYVRPRKFPYNSIPYKSYSSSSLLLLNIRSMQVPPRGLPNPLRAGEDIGKKDQSRAPCLADRVI